MSLSGHALCRIGVAGHLTCTYPAGRGPGAGGLGGPGRMSLLGKVGRAVVPAMAVGKDGVRLTATLMPGSGPVRDWFFQES